MLKGKFGYMSPEQVRGESMDRRSDLFAIGTLLWEMCTEERLFTGPSDFAVLDKVRNASVPPPSAHNPMIPPELEAIIMRALRRDPAERYQWATDMQEALEAYLAARSPQWNNTTVSKTIKKMFQQELERDQALLKQYQMIRKEDLAKFAASGPVRAGRAVSLLHQPVEPKREPSARRDISDATSELAELASREIDLVTDPGAAATQVSGQVELDELEPDQLSAPTLASTASGAIESCATQIFGAEVSVAGGALSAEPTFIFNAELGQMVQAAQRPVYLEPEVGEIDSGNGRAGQQAVDPGPTVVFNLEEDEELAGHLNAPPLTSTASVVMAPSTMAKDIVIGVLSAAVLILVAVVAWNIGGSAPDLPAALVINVAGVAGADVSVDGRSHGVVSSRQPLTLRGVTPGTHRVVLLPEDGDPVAREVQVAAGEIKVLTVMLSARPSKIDVGIDADAGAAAAGAVPTRRVAEDARVADGEAARSRGEPPAAGGGAVAGSPPADSSTQSGESRRHEDAVRPSRSPQRRSSRRSTSRQQRRRSRATAAGTASTSSRRAKRRTAEAGRPGYLVANTIPWARILVDGRDTGRTTPISQSSKIRLAPGRHEVTFIAGGKRFSFKVKIVSGKVTRLIKRLPVE